MNQSSPTVGFGWRTDFREKRNSRGALEEKTIGGLFNKSLEGGCFVFRDDHDDGSHKKKKKKCEKEMMVGLVPSQRSSLDLMQNCDLPPPVKIFAAADNTFRTSSKFDREAEDELFRDQGTIQDEKLGLIKALQLSQTRAREAERKATLLTRERDRLSHSFLEESLKLFAHRQWVKVLELEVSQLQFQKQNQQQSQLHHSHKQQQPCRRGCGCRFDKVYGMSEEEDEEETRKANGGDAGSSSSSSSNLTWCMTLTLCLGIAGVGFACKYLF